MSDLTVRAATDADRPALDAYLSASWGRTYIVRRGERLDLTALPTLVAEREGGLAGALTYRVTDAGLEVVTIDGSGGGAGTALLSAAKYKAVELGLRRLWLVTTNDNVDAMRFYQRRGLRITGVAPGAVDLARALKPSIPAVGSYDIPLHDELVLELRLDGDEPYVRAEKAGARALGETLTWRGGGTDLWPLLRDPVAFADVVGGLGRRFMGRVDVVLGPDPGGVLFGPPVARELGVPFAPVCRDRRFFFQGEHEHVSAAVGADTLYAHRAALADGARVLVVDDWSESGATLRAVAALVGETKAVLTAVSLLVDSLPEDVRDGLRGDGVEVVGLVGVEDLTVG